jgi:ankyrin repeat domain-containing protein 50
MTGGMGSGKSILTSYLVDRVKPLLGFLRHTDSHKVTVCSFFCDDRDVGRNHGQAILRGLLYQILHQRHDLIEHATARLSDVVPGRWSIFVLWEILRDIMLNSTTGTVIFIIDAMDECEPVSRDRVLTVIKQFLEQDREPSSNCVKFFISSRPNVDLTEEVGSYAGIISLDDEAEIRDVERDILLVVKHQLDELAIKAQWPTNTREALERSIVMKADRNFLWVRLVIQRLKKGPQTRKFFDQVIDQSPKDLDGLYCRILADIDTENKGLAAKILRILVGSLRPLTTAELRLALAIDLRHHALKSVEEESDMAIERTVRLVLGPLVRIYNLKVHLVHQSAKEFLLRLSTGNVADIKSFLPDLRTLYGISLSAANLELATACVAFLGLADFEKNRVLDENVSAFLELPGATEDSPWFLMQRADDSLSNDPGQSPRRYATTSTDEKPQFFEYSASHWTTHLCASGASLPQQLLESSIRISRRGTNCLANWSDQYRLSSNG